MPTPEEVLQECAIAFPSLNWSYDVDRSNKNWKYYHAKNEWFVVELRQHKNDFKGYVYICERWICLPNKTIPSPTQALAEIKAIVLDLISELQSVLGEK
jgi:hypothetical protein